MSEFCSITKIKRDSTFEMKNEHYHNYYEFYYLLSGRRKFFLNNKLYHVHAGDLMAIPKGEIHRTTYFPEDILATGHSIQSLHDHERFALCFDDSLIAHLKEEIGENGFMSCFEHRQITIPLNRRAYFEELFEKLLQESKGNDEFSNCLCKRYCEEIILLLIRCQRYHEPEAVSMGIEDKQMEMAAQYMSTHFHENLSLKDLANKCCMSESYFSRRFKQVTGFGFKEYLNTIRIRHACDLLLQTNKSIMEISEECGYMDSNYFGDAFRKVKNVSPSKYRKVNLI